MLATALSSEQRTAAYGELAKTTEVNLLRIPNIGDGASVNVQQLGIDTGWFDNRRNFSLANAAKDQLGPIKISVDATAVSDVAGDRATKVAAANRIQQEICGAMKTWFQERIKDIGATMKDVKAFMQKHVPEVKTIAKAAVGALVTLGMSSWAAYLCLGLVVGLVAVAIYCLVKYGAEKYCKAGTSQ